MFQIPLLNSPLAEKRIIFFMIKKQMIGRRAYTDSIYKRAINISSKPVSPAVKSNMFNTIDETMGGYSTKSAPL